MRLERLLVPTLAVLIGMTASLRAAQSGAAQPAAMAAVAYTLQRGDEISIKVFGRPELDDTVIVRPDGYISAPLVDELAVADRTAAQVDDLLTERLSKFFREPQVSVIVRRIANLKVFVGGEVGQPGVIPIFGEVTVLGAIYQAGGFRATARTDSVMLLRQGEGGKAVVRQLDLKRLEKNEALLALQPHDVVFVPMSRIANVNRFIDQYARQLLPISLTAGFSYVIGDAFRPQ